MNEMNKSTAYLLRNRTNGNYSFIAKQIFLHVNIKRKNALFIIIVLHGWYLF